MYRYLKKTTGNLMIYVAEINYKETSSSGFESSELKSSLHFFPYPQFDFKSKWPIYFFNTLEMYV